MEGTQVGRPPGQRQPVTFAAGGAAIAIVPPWVAPRLYTCSHIGPTFPACLLLAGSPGALGARPARPLLDVSEMLGHALRTTQIYLNIAANGLLDSMRKFEEAKKVAVARPVQDGQVPSPGCRPVADDTPVEHPPSCNGDSPTSVKVVVN